MTNCCVKTTITYFICARRDNKDVCDFFVGVPFQTQPEVTGNVPFRECVHAHSVRNLMDPKICTNAQAMDDANKNKPTGDI